MNLLSSNGRGGMTWEVHPPPPLQPLLLSPPLSADPLPASSSSLPLPFSGSLITAASSSYLLLGGILRGNPLLGEGKKFAVLFLIDCPLRPTCFCG